LEAAASEAAGTTPRREPPPTIDLGLREWIVVGSMTAVGWTGQILMLIFLVYFMLVSDDLFKRKLVRIAGPAFGQKRITVSMLDGIQASLERFILVTVALNALIAVATFLAFQAYGVSGAPLWGVLGGALNFIPYLGSAIAAALFFVVALLQFDALSDAVIVAAMFVAISSIEGMLLKPWLIGRTARINNVAVFASLFFWGWVWGAWGLLLAFPILMVVKIVADHAEQLQPVSELLKS
jgi:predicted PurR-regulated permease PerM